MKTHLRFVWLLAIPLVLIAAGINTDLPVGAQEEIVVPDLPQQRSAPPEWIAQIESERDAAYSEITAGNLTAGSLALVQSLRALPVDHPELIDTAYGSVQLLLYTMEYLMDEPTRTQFVEQSLDPEHNPIDRFIVSGYNIYIGQDTPEKTLAAQDLLAAAATDNPFARIGALFILSDPYFFDNADFTRQSQEILAAEYPDLAITLEAYRYNIYGARKSGAEIIENASRTFTAKSSKASTFVKDPVIAATIEATRNGSTKSASDAIGVYARALDSTGDWKARFGLLLMLEPYGATERARVMEICERLAAPKDKPEFATPDAVRAQLMLLKLERGQWDATPGDPGTGPQGMQWVDNLLATKWKENPFERCLYEDVMKGVMNCAGHLDKIGRPLIAIRVFDKLAKQYPNSLVSAQCQSEMARIREEHRPD